MMITQLKQRIFFVGILLAVVITTLVILSLSQIMSSFQEGADAASIFRGNELILPETSEAQWGDDLAVISEVPTASEREEILSAYWLAWEAIQRAQETQDLSDLNTYFALPALTAVQDSFTQSASTGFSTSQHQLQLRFFSEDHSVVSFRDDYLTTVIVASQEKGIPTSAEITMTNDSGRWRIRLMTITYTSDT